jgi:hypothetical protein
MLKMETQRRRTERETRRIKTRSKMIEVYAKL